MVKTQSDERGAQEQQNDRPRTNRGVVRRRADGREAVAEPPRKPHQTAWGNQFRKIVERTLPADVFSLGRRRKLRHLDPVGRDVVHSTAEGNNGKDNNTDREEQRKLKRKGRCAEHRSASGSRRPRTSSSGTTPGTAPQELDRPRPHDQRRPERYLSIRDPQLLVQNCRDHVQNDKRRTHRKVQ